MRVGCIVLAHRAPSQLQLLLESLRHRDLRLYLHLDQRTDIAAFQRALAGPDVPEIVWLERRRTRWGGIEVVDAVLEGLGRGLTDGCEYFLVISGQDFPLRPAEAIVDFAAAAGSRSYVEHWQLPDPRWRFGGRDRTEFYTYNLFGRRETAIPRGEDTSSLSWKGRALNEALRLRSALKPARRFPDYVQPYGGWSWLNLSRPAAEHIVTFTRSQPGYREYHRHTLSADEIFFHSILLGTGFAERCEVVNDSLRFTIWPTGATHPRTLTHDDLPAMLASQNLFARKFDTEIDARALTELATTVAP